MRDAAQVDGVADGETIVIMTLAAQPDVLPDDGDKIELDDMRGAMDEFNNQHVAVKRIAYTSPAAAGIYARSNPQRSSLFET